MKLKKLLSFALALAMVLAFIPAMSLTASADSTTGIIDTYSADVLWSAPEGTYSDSAFSWTDWTATETSGNHSILLSTVSNAGNVLKFSAANSSTYYATTDIDATITSPGYGAGAESLIIEWKTAYSTSSSGGTDDYYYFVFYDIDGVQIAALDIDKGYTSADTTHKIGFPAVGTDCALIITNNDDDTHNVLYCVAGEVVATELYLDGSINGFGSMKVSSGYWTRTGNYIGFGDLTIASSDKTIGDFANIAVYMDGESVGYVGYSALNTTTDVVYSDEYYSPNGSNTMYYKASTLISGLTIIDGEAVANTGNYSAGDTLLYEGTQYIVQSDNIVPNGDFSYGMNGWWNRKTTYPYNILPTAPTNYSITTEDVPSGVARAAVSSGNGGSSSTNSIKRAWTVTPGTTYYYSLWVKAGDEWHGMGETDNPTTETSTLVANGEFGKSGTWVQTTGKFTATENYVIFFEGWDSVGVADVEIYPIEEDASAKYYSVSYQYEDGTVIYDEPTNIAYGTVIPSRTFYADGKIYTTPETTVEGETVITATVAQEYAVQKDVLWTQDQEIWGGVNSNHLFVASCGTENGDTRAYASDEDGNTLYNTSTATLGKSRYAMVQYALPAYEEGKTYTLVLPINSFHEYCWNGGGKTNDALRFAAYRLADGTEFEDQSEGITGVASYASVGNAIYSDWTTSSSTELVFDVTDAVKQATGNTITFKILANVGAVYLNEWEITGFGETKEGLASYIAVSDGDYTVTVDDASYITVNGSKMSDTTATVNDGDYIYAYGSDYYYEATTGTVYDGSTKIDVTSDLDLTGMSLGVDLLNGAQIRIGDGAEEEELVGDSGLRFIATVDTANKLAGVSGAVVGIAISADDTFDANEDTLVPAVEYQDTSVFTVAVTNIKPANYNRVYYAIPYVKIGDDYYTGTAVARTPYQVAAGILADEADGTVTDGDDYLQSNVESSALYAVLNVYANKVGARLTLASDGNGGYTVLADIESNDKATSGAYANNAVAFFDAACTVDDTTGDCTIVLSGKGAAEFYSYAIDQYRINNSHKALADGGASAVINADGTMTITIPAALLVTE